MMSRLEGVLTGLLLVAWTMQAPAQDAVQGDASAQGPGGPGRPSATKRADVLFSTSARDADAARPSLPGALRERARLADAPSTPEEQGRLPGAVASAAAPSAPQEASRGTPAEPQRLPLGPPKPGTDEEQGTLLAWWSLDAERSLSSMLGGLSIVIGTFLLFAWALRKRMPKGSARLPDEIIEVLGRTSLAAKQSLHLIRVGGKLIVVSVTAAGTETLTEITDPGEVTRILAACQRHQSQSSTADFRKLFEQLSREPASGFLEADPGRTELHRSGPKAA